MSDLRQPPESQKAAVDNQPTVHGNDGEGQSSPVGRLAATVERLRREGELRPELIAAVRDCARAVSRDLGAGRF